MPTPLSEEASSGTRAFGRWIRERSVGEVRFADGPDRDLQEFASAGTGKRQASGFGSTSGSRETARVRSVGDPERVPSKLASMGRPGNLEEASASEGNPKGNRPRPKGLGRNPIPGGTPSFGRSVSTVDSGGRQQCRPPFAFEPLRGSCRKRASRLCCGPRRRRSSVDDLNPSAFCHLQSARRCGP